MRHVWMFFFLLHVAIASAGVAASAAGCCAHIFSVNWVDSCWKNKIINSLVSSQYHRNKFVPRLFNILCQTAENHEECSRLPTNIDRCFACRKHFSFIKMLRKKNKQNWQRKSQSTTPHHFAWQIYKFLLEIITLNCQFKSNWRNC